MVCLSSSMLSLSISKGCEPLKVQLFSAVFNQVSIVTIGVANSFYFAIQYFMRKIDQRDRVAQFLNRFHPVGGEQDGCALCD